MEETYLLNHLGVKKKILAGGSGPMPHFPHGTKLVFHFQTLLDDFERTVIDDSRLAGRPAEIFVGKMFKMEVWETLLTSMRVGEVAEFWCDPIHTGLYPIVSKGMRLIAQGKDPLEGQRHMCGMGNMFNYHTTGWPELDELMRTPQPLIFIMELLQVGDPMSYHRESWMMEKDEKLQAVPSLHMLGNALVKQRRFREAASKYKEAVLLLKTVQSRERPSDIDYINLGRMIIPLELNYCQCMLELEEYYEAIEHTTELLDKHPDCVKGYYKRAKAHAAVWNDKEARTDFHRVANLDASLASLVGRELKQLAERMKEKYWEEKDKYWNMLESKEGQEEKKEEEEEEKEEEEEEEEEEKTEVEEKQEADSGSVSTGSRDGVGNGEAKEESLSMCAEMQEPEVTDYKAVEKTKETAEEAGDCRDGSSEVSSCTPSHTVGKDWQQMLRLVMILHKEGNFLIREKRFDEASVKLQEAKEYVDCLQCTYVDPGSEDWESLERVRLPLTLNLSQCLLELQEYEDVVELNSRLLNKHKGNFKAMYQRGRAHAALCNKDAAQKDFTMVEKLDPTFKPIVQLEMRKMLERVRVKQGQQKKTYWDTVEERRAAAGSKPGSKARSTGKHKNVRFAQKAVEGKNEEKNETDETSRNGKTKDNESPEKHPDVKAAQTDTGLVHPDVEAEQTDTGLVHPDVKAEQTDTGLVHPDVKAAQTDTGLVHPDVKAEQTDTGLVHPDVEAEQTDTGLVHPDVKAAQTDTGLVHPDVKAAQTDTGLVHPDVKAEQTDTGLVHPDVKAEQTETGLVHPAVEAEQTDTGLVHPDVEAEQTDTGLVHPDVEAEQTETGLVHPAVEAEQTDTGLVHPDVEAEQTETGPERGTAGAEGPDSDKKESVVGQAEGQGAPGNGAAGGDRDPGATGAGKDNVASNRSAPDKGKKKVKRRPRAKAGQGNKATGDKAGRGGNQSK